VGLSAAGSNSFDAGEACVRRLLGSTDWTGFFRDYWEQRHLHVPAGSEGLHKFADFLPADALDQFLARNDVRYPSIQLVKSGRSVPISEYARKLKIGSYSSDGLIDMDLVATRYREGCTIVLQLMQLSLPSAAELSAKLGAFFRSKVDVHGFLTPSNAQGLTAHYDVGGAFLVQIRGAKRWRLFAMQVDTPSDQQTFDTNRPIEGSPIDEIELRAGDVLYLPGGVPHEGLTVGTDSLHLTLGLFTPTWREIMESTLVACEELESFRRAPAYLASSATANSALEPDWQERVEEFSSISEKQGRAEIRRAVPVVLSLGRRGRWL
jgi:ribosomal protein L16 Arg81 hydroxylase